MRRYREIFGNAENEAGQVGDVALEAFDNLISNAPTSVRGVRALLSYLLEDVDDLGQQFFEEDKLRVLLNSIDEALQDKRPNLAVPA